jgi:hypothetical protein
MAERMKEAAAKPAAAPAPPPTASAQPSSSTNSPERSVNDSALSLTAQAPDNSRAPVSTAGTGNHDYVQDDADYSEDDNDSAFGGSLIGSDTVTLASYITDYRYENGRQYHAFREGEYWVSDPRSQLQVGGQTDYPRDQTTRSRMNCRISHITCTS